MEALGILKEVVGQPHLGPPGGVAGGGVFLPHKWTSISHIKCPGLDCILQKLDVLICVEREALLHLVPQLLNELHGPEGVRAMGTFF